MQCPGDARGTSLAEVLLVLALATIVGGTALGAFLRARDHARGIGAARALALHILATRLDALRRGTTAGIEFAETPEGFTMQAVVDDNGNGLRADEVASGVDRRLGPPFRLRDEFPGARFAVAYPMPPIDGEGSALAPGADPIQIGRSAFLAFGPSGTGSSGTLYVVGPENRQFAVRLFGPTGRVRLFEFLPGPGRWIEP